MFAIAQYSDRYQTMTRAHENGAKDGSNNVPSASHAALSSTELAITQLAQDDVTRHSAKLKLDNERTFDKLRAWQSGLTDDFLQTLDDFDSRAELVLTAATRNLLRLYETMIARKQEYRYFKTINRLNRDAQIPDSHFLDYAMLIFVMAVESVMNAFFFKDSNPLALVGGFAQAGIISLINTSGGFVTGLLPWRYLQHRRRLHLVWAFPLLTVMLSSILVFNLAIGHFRDLLEARKEASAVDIYDIMMSSAFSFQSTNSIVLAFVGFGIAMFAAYKGYTFFDSYPQFGKYYKRMGSANDRFDSRLQVMEKELGGLAKDFLNTAKANFKETSKLINNCLSELDAAIDRNKDSCEAFLGIVEACNAAVRTYRDANLRVRDIDRYPPPAYFSSTASLSVPDVQAGLEALQKLKIETVSLNDQIKANYTILCNELPKRVRHLTSESELKARLNSIKETAERNLRDQDNP